MPAVSSDLWKIGETAAPLPPKVPGLPLLGSALDMRREPSRFLTEMYQRYGPIFRVQLLNREIYVLAGSDANKFTSQMDEEVFTNELVFAGLRQELGPSFTSGGPDEHRYTRRLVKPAYSRSIALEKTPLLIEIVDEFIDRLEIGQSFEVFPAMQELVVTQLGAMLLDQRPGEYFNDFRRFMFNMLEVYQFSMKPAWMLKLPGYQRARRRSFEMAEKVLAHIRSTQAGEDRPESTIDILSRSVDYQGQPFTEAHFLGEAMGPYLAGQDTVAGTLAFICYTVHKYPQVLERIQAELETGFADGIPPANEMRRFEVLHKAIQETMRRYPVATAMPRHAGRTFEFSGFRVPAGVEVFCATSVTHFLPEFYPNPYTFDIDRPRGPSGSFSPYGVGNYACLGAGIADVQLMVTMAALLRRARFELDPAGYEANLATIPLPNPGRYRLKLTARHP